MDINIGKGITIPIDTQALIGSFEGENPVRDHIVYIGLRNILMDCHANIATTEPDYQEKARAVAEKKLTALMAGELRTAGTRTREGDPVRAEAVRLATAQIKALLRSKGRKAHLVKPAAFKAAAEKLLADPVRGAPILAMAKSRVDEAKTLTADEDILEGI